MGLDEIDLGQSFGLPDITLRYMLTKHIFNWRQININRGDIINVAYCSPQRIYQNIKMRIRSPCDEKDAQNNTKL